MILKVKVESNCARCGNVYMKCRKNHRYCSAKCRDIILRKTTRKNKPGYQVYASIKTRCSSPLYRWHEYYFDKGIRDEFGSYEEFSKFYLSRVSCDTCGNPFGTGLKSKSVDRIDPNRNYSATNCRLVCAPCNTKNMHLFYKNELEALKRLESIKPWQIS